MKIKKHEQEVSLEQIGKDLAQLTMEATQIHFKTQKTNKLDKQCWAWMGIGFTTALQLYNPNFTDEMVDKIIKESQKHLK